MFADYREIESAQPAGKNRHFSVERVDEPGRRARLARSNRLWSACYLARLKDDFESYEVFGNDARTLDGSLV
jgi:hypothetical protein